MGKNAWAARSAGFTMIELLVVMAVLGILAAAILPLGEALLVAQKERELRQALWEIRSAIDEYKRYADRGAIAASAGSSGYPPTLAALVDGVQDLRGVTGTAPAGGTTGARLYFLRRVPRDPLADPALPAEQTWALRSYASAPDRPAPGVDVFDVRSASKAIALDGTPYAQW